MHELCLFGTRGNGWKVRTSSNSVRGTIHEKKREHSRKPESFYNVIESRSEGPYLELFGRQVRNGWDVKGDQTNLFNLNVKQENESLQDNYVEVADVGGTEGG
jgi:N6-adenosine-specific RNA methylase IME4